MGRRVFSRRFAGLIWPRQVGIRISLALDVRYSVGRRNYDSWLRHKRALNRSSHLGLGPSGDPGKRDAEAPDAGSLHDGSVRDLGGSELSLEPLSRGNSHSDGYLHPALCAGLANLGTLPWN